MSFLKKNICDGLEKTASILFTSVCDNKCKLCISKDSLKGYKKKKPDVDALINSVFHSDDLDFETISILGGEPCLYLEELYEFIMRLRMAKPELKIELTTAVPKTCLDNYELFFKILDEVDFIIFSVQSHIPEIADNIRGTKSKFDRNAFYWAIPQEYKSKIQISFLLTEEMMLPRMITQCVKFFAAMNYQSIRISEVSGEGYVSFEDVMKIKLPSPFSHGCLTDVSKYVGITSCPVYLRRRCFVVEPSRDATLLDLFKVWLVRVLRDKFHYENHLHKYILCDGKKETNWTIGKANKKEE